MDIEYISSFGDDATGARNDDKISTIAFSPQGDFLAVGINSGCAVIFSLLDNCVTFLCQIQAHKSEFDFLKSTFSSQVVKSIKWIPSYMKDPMFLTSNSNKIKLWKLNYTKEVTWDNCKGRSVETFKPPVPKKTINRYFPECLNTFNNLFADTLVNVQCLEDQRSFIAVDETGVTLWDYETCNNVSLIRTNANNNQNTASATHNSLPFNFLIGDSNGIVKLYDLRQQPEGLTPSLSFNTTNHRTKTDLYNGTQSISYLTIGNDARTFASRTFGDVQLWDFRNINKPLAVTDVQWFPEHMDWVANEGFTRDLFNVSITKDNIVLTGMYSADFISWDPTKNIKYRHRALSSRSPVHPPEPGKDFYKRVTWIESHPTKNIFALAATSALYLFKGVPHKFEKQ